MPQPGGLELGLKDCKENKTPSLVQTLPPVSLSSSEIKNFPVFKLCPGVRGVEMKSALMT